MTHPGMAEAFAVLRFQNALASRTGPDMEEVYQKVVNVLDVLGVRWTIVGAHAVNVYVRPRATVDLDLVVEASRMSDILEALDSQLGEQRRDDIGAALRLLDLSVDLIRSDNHVLFRAALDEAALEGEARVPPPELLITLKFLAALSPWRKAADRAQDTVDLIRIYQTLGSRLDRDAMLRHASTIYPGAEDELARILERIDRGERVQI